VNIQETAAVLAKIKLGDNREVDSKGLVLREWHEAIGDLEYGDAIEAVAMHRRESQVYLVPAHVRENVRRVRAAREREDRVSNPRQIEPPTITLDREAFDRETDYWIEYWREVKAHG
jgi:hypothetical protein